MPHHRVLVAMSGGVDSSVAAALLVERGYDVVGVTMKLFSDGTDLPDRPCCSLDSTSDARRVCERLGVPHYVVNMESRFTRDVVDDFVAEYVAGRTPIPCVRCNTFTKFRDLLRVAETVDAPLIATGHYARVHDGRLLRGRDDAKDQTYFLWGIERDVVQRLLLPVGDLTKAETRAIAARLGLTMVAHKPESQDICFVPDGDHTRIIAERAGADSPALSPGPIVTIDGDVVGEHSGYARYTVGQRRGLPGGFAEPLYVVEIRPDERAVVVGPRAALLGHGIRARGVNWLVQPAPQPGTQLLVRARHRAPLTPAELVRVDGDEVEVALDEPIAAIAPGQSLVLYDASGAVLGGGIIAAARAGKVMLPLLA
jgi:tRNA-specific 2-thiouridylase